MLLLFNGWNVPEQHQAVGMRREGTLCSAAVNLARTVIDRSAFYSPKVLPRITLT
jgi:hypothetical protein